MIYVIYQADMVAKSVMTHRLYRAFIITTLLKAATIVIVNTIVAIINANTLLPKEGDDVFKEVHQFRTVHLYITVRPTESVPDKTLNVRILRRLIEVLNTRLGTG